MKKATKRIVWGATLLALSGAFIIWLYGEIQIDKCLDAGGAWDYEKHRCTFQSR